VTTTNRKKKRTSFRIGDRVVRNKAVGGSNDGSNDGSIGQRGDVVGTIIKVTAVTHGAGGTRARVRVRWDNGYEASVEDRQIVRAP
jgi:hypothetical protein